jgi:hypothetical protein
MDNGLFRFTLRFQKSGSFTDVLSTSNSILVNDDMGISNYTNFMAVTFTSWLFSLFEIEQE